MNEEKKYRLIDRWTLVAVTAALFSIVIMWAFMFNALQKSARNDDILIHSQQQTISAQETIIDVQKGLINGLVIENNSKLLELNDYKSRWLEAIK